MVGISAKKIINKAKGLKTARQMERHLKGIANHWRISAILLLGERSGLNVDEIVGVLGGNYTTISIHISKLVQAGLVEKKYTGRTVVHRLTPYGKTFYKFLTTFQHF